MREEVVPDVDLDFVVVILVGTILFAICQRDNGLGDFYAYHRPDKSHTIGRIGS